MKGTEYFLEKSIWTHDDFEIMGWHDASIYGFVFEKIDLYTGNLLFDIDYIFEWMKPTLPETYYSFWVAPCTLIFEEAYNLEIDIDTGLAIDALEVADLCMNKSKDYEYEWTIELQRGSISFKSLGMQQIVRKYPIFNDKQILNIEDRGGINFTKSPITINLNN